MLKQIKFGILATLVVFLGMACSNDGSVREQAVQDATGETVAAVAPETEAIPEGPTTVITWEINEFDFGKVKAGPPVRKTYKFKNTGDQPLVITNAKGSCGCTVPDWPKEPIPVGGTGEIVLEFDTKGRSGMQAKQVTVTANTNPPQTILYLKGDLIAEDNTSGQ